MTAPSLSRGAPVLVIATLLAGCVADTGGGPATTAPSRLATNASLSAEAIQLQSASERLLTLEELQNAAGDRERSYAMQGAVLGGVGGAALGVGVACGMAALQGREYDENTMIVAGVGRAAAGGANGYRTGREVAQTQSHAAARETELKRRLQIAGQQLDTARQARRDAEAVVAENQRKLASPKAEVAAGRASKEQLDIARADARADADQIRAAVSSMGGSAASLSSDPSVAQTQSASQASLRNAQAALTREQQLTTNQ